jgi:hypothetical protein
MSFCLFALVLSVPAVTSAPPSVVLGVEGSDDRNVASRRRIVAAQTSPRFFDFFVASGERGKPD